MTEFETEIIRLLSLIEQSLRKAQPVKSKPDKREKFGSVVKMEKPEMEELKKDYGDMVILEIIEEMDNYCLAKGKRYKDYFAAKKQWLQRKGAIKKKYIDWSQFKDYNERVDFVIKNPEYLELLRESYPEDAIQIDLCKIM